MAKTTINYLTHTINPIRAKGGGFACTKVSPGCLNCWASDFSRRFHKRGYTYDDLHIEYKLDLECFDKLPKRKPAIVGVQFMSDLFHNDITAQNIIEIWAQMEIKHQHTYLILTKRPENIAERLWPTVEWGDDYLLKNVWLGTSVEDQETYDLRVPKLLCIPAALHWVSIEPLLDPIDTMVDSSIIYPKDSPHPEWIVVGCESGPKRRPCKIEWVESIVEQCKSANVPVWVKQIEIDGKVERDIDKFPKHLQIREYPTKLTL